MKLEELVPPIVLCKKIPAGEFEDSAFIWINGIVHGRFFDIPNTIPPSIQKTIFPAPTAAEILKVLWDDYQKPTVYFRNIWCATVVNNYGDEIAVVDNENAANAALKLWLRLKGIEE